MMPLVLVFMLIVIGFLVVIALRYTGDKRPFLHGSRSKWFVLGYSFILFISVGVYYLMPSPNTIYSEKVEMQEWFDMYPYVSGLMDVKELEPYIRGVHSFDFSGDELRLDLQGALYFDYMYVRVENSADLTDQIEVIYYETPTAIDGIDISQDIPKIDFNMTDDALSLYLPGDIDITVMSYKNEFPFNQFLLDRELDLFMNVMFSERLIYLKVPEHVRVAEDDMIELHYVE